MEVSDLNESIFEARRFIKRANAAIERIQGTGHDYNIVGYKETAAARRSSMDLSRALAKLRKG